MRKRSTQSKRLCSYTEVVEIDEHCSRSSGAVIGGAVSAVGAVGVVAAVVAAAAVVMVSSSCSAAAQERTRIETKREREGENSTRRENSAISPWV